MNAFLDTVQQLEITAFHEAGHALVARLLGIEVRKVSIIHTEELSGYCQFDPFTFYKFRSNMENRTKYLPIVVLSGMASELLAFGRYDTLGATEDIETAKRLIISMNSGIVWGDSCLNHYQNQALFLLRRYWDPLYRIAHLLLQQNEITSQELTRCMRASGVSTLNIGSYKGPCS